MIRVIAWAVFVLAFALWTWKLLEPKPIPDPIYEFLSFYDWLPFLLAKCLHLSGYAFLTALLWVAVPRRWRWTAVAFLLLHGVGTEIGQTFVPNRSGSVRDVVIDWCGVAVGASFAATVLWRERKSGGR